MSLNKCPGCDEELELDTQISPTNCEASEVIENDLAAPPEAAPITPMNEEPLAPADEKPITPADEEPIAPIDDEPITSVEDTDAPEEEIAQAAGEETPKQKTVIPSWVKLLPGIVIVSALFIFLFVLVLGDHEPIAPPTPNAGVESSDTTAPTAEFTEPTVPPTAPADGNPDDITCQGSYSVLNTTKTADDVVATLGEKELTNAQLQVYYWQEVYNYLTENSDHGISLNHTLDVQMCTVSDTPMTWQQYFLQRAIDTWQVYQALALDSDANEFGLDESYRDYLNALPERLEQIAVQKGYSDAVAMIVSFAGSGVSVADYALYVRLYEEGHIYFDRVYQNTTPSANQIEGYYAANSDAYTDISGKYVDIRHIMLTPDGSTAEAWDACKQEAENLLRTWKQNATDVNFADLAFEYSADPGSNNNGGLYSNVYDGLFANEINDWCFDSSRRKGDTAIFKTNDGYHILYFSASRDARDRAAELDLIADTVSLLVPAALQNYTLTVDYSAIAVGNVELSGLDAATISDRAAVLNDLCQDFPDAAYERYPTVPLYIQQDYPHVYYGGYGDTVVTHGCGITAMAMLATYMTDTEQSVEEMAKRYRGYGSSNGTSRNLFDEAPITMGFYMDTRVGTWAKVMEALQAGKIVISLQHKGRFTNGGHYLLLFAATDEGRIMIRDSNRFNYTVRFVNTDFYENGFPAEYFPPANVAYWVFEPKVTQIAACARCGDAGTEGLPTALLRDTYYCPKCATALHLREVYDTACDIDLLDEITPPDIDDVVISEPEPDDQPTTKPTTPDTDVDEPDETEPDETVPDDTVTDDTPDNTTTEESTPMIPDESQPEPEPEPEPEPQPEPEPEPEPEPGQESAA